MKSSQMFQPSSVKTLRSIRKGNQVDDLISEIQDVSTQNNLSIQDQPPTVQIKPSQSSLHKSQTKDAFVRNITSAASTRSQKISQLTTPKTKLNQDSDSSSESADSIVQSYQENHLTFIYADDNFLKHRKEYEKQLVQDVKLQVERQQILSEMDQTLADLTKWRAERERQKKQNVLIPEITHIKQESQLVDSDREIELEMQLQKIREQSVLQYGDFSSLKALPKTKDNENLTAYLQKQESYLQKLKKSTLEVKKPSPALKDYSDVLRDLQKFEVQTNEMENDFKNLQVDTVVSEQDLQQVLAKTDNSQKSKLADIISDIDNELAELDQLLNDL